MIAVANAHKGKVKITFAHGAHLKNLGRLFNAGNGNERREIEIFRRRQAQFACPEKSRPRRDCLQSDQIEEEREGESAQAQKSVTRYGRSAVALLFRQRVTHAQET